MNENVPHITGLLSAYLDKQLTGTEQQRVEAHLPTCETCQKRLESIFQFRQALLKAPVLNPPNNFNRDVMGHIQALKWRILLPIGKWILLIVAAGALVSGVWWCVQYFYQPSGPNDSQQSMTGLFSGGLNSMKSYLKENVSHQWGNNSRPENNASPAQRAPETPSGFSSLKLSTATMSVVSDASSPRSGDTHSHTATVAQPVQSAVEHLISPVATPDNGPEPDRPSPPKPTVAPGVPAAPVSEPITAAVPATVPTPAVPPPAKVAPVVPEAPAVLSKPVPVAAPNNRTSSNDITEWKGTYCGVTTPLHVVITSTAMWKKYWKYHASVGGSHLALPRIDFEHYEIIAVYAGQKAFKGYSIKIESVQKTQGVLRVSYREYAPPRSSATTRSPTQPFHLLVIPKTTLPTRFKKLP